MTNPPSPTRSASKSARSAGASSGAAARQSEGRKPATRLTPPIVVRGSRSAATALTSSWARVWTASNSRYACDAVPSAKIPPCGVLTPRMISPVARLNDEQRVLLRIVEPEHRRYGIAHARDLVTDVDALRLQLGVVGIDVGGVERDTGLAAAGRLPFGRVHDRDRCRAALRPDLDPAVVAAHRDIDALLEPERAAIEVDCPLLIVDRDDHATDLADVHLLLLSSGLDSVGKTNSAAETHRDFRSSGVSAKVEP